MNEKLGMGRNFVKKEVVNNEIVLRKKLSGKDDGKRRSKNLLIWDSLIDEFSITNSPKLKSYIENENIFNYEYISHNETLQDRVSSEDTVVKTELINDAVNIITKIHNINYSDLILKNELLKEEFFSKKYLELFDVFTMEEFCTSTGAELELFSLLQQDTQFCNGVKKIITDYKIEKYGILHGDMRLDQFIIDFNNKVWLIDFEELKIGDVKEDVGNLVGSVLFECLMKIFSNPKLGNDDIDQGIQDLGRAYLPIAKDLIIKIIEKYNSNTKDTLNIIDLHFYIGFFILERLISRAKFSFKLTPVDKAILGIGREIILNPGSLEEFIR